MDKPTLIHKVLCANANEAEKAELKAWISSDPGHAEEFEDLKLLYENALNIEERIAERDDKFYGGLRNIHDRIKALKRGRKKARLYKIAGIVIGISAIVITVSIYLFNLHKPIPQLPDKINDGITSGILLYGNLSFENTTLESIFKILEDRYHLTFKVGSKELLSCRFSGTFFRGLTIDEMIRVLAQSENFNYTVVNSKTYELHGEGCPL